SPDRVSARACAVPARHDRGSTKSLEYVSRGYLCSAGLAHARSARTQEFYGVRARRGLTYGTDWSHQPVPARNRETLPTAKRGKPPRRRWPRPWEPAGLPSKLLGALPVATGVDGSSPSAPRRLPVSDRSRAPRSC